jgi:PKD domain
MTWGKLAAVKHANGRDWWFVAPPHFSNKYIIGLLDPTGISIRTDMVGDSIREGLGQAFFTPDGARYIKTEQTYLNQPGTISIFDFDRCAGQLSNQRSHLVPPAEVDYGMGGAVSPDSRYLYAFFTEKVLQYDLSAADIFATETIVGQFDGFVSGFYGAYFLFAQSAPDGRIYDMCWSGTYHMHQVKFPTRQGLSCEFVNHSIESPVTIGHAIPNHPNYRLDALDGSSCDTLGFDNHPRCHWRWEQEDTLAPLQVTFTDLSSYEPATWHWDFGDGNTSQDISPVHTYLVEGTYMVCLAVGNQYSADTLCRVLHLGTSAATSPEFVAVVRVFPNPFDEHLSVALPKVSLRGCVLRLHDQMGREVLRQELAPGITEVSTAGLSPGMYFYGIELRGEVLKSGKVIKVSE